MTGVLEPFLRFAGRRTSACSVTPPPSLMYACDQVAPSACHHVFACAAAAATDSAAAATLTRTTSPRPSSTDFDKAASRAGLQNEPGPCARPVQPTCWESNRRLKKV